MEFIRGKTFIEGQSLSENQIQEAVRFFESLNKDREGAKQLVSMDAAEGFLKLTDHLNNVEQRISRLTTRHVPIALIDKSSQLINQLNSQYDLVRQMTLTSIAQGKTNNETALDQRCVSASDFGFHNAIQTEHGVKFIDFEFAGWDDPAKASLDFVLQPKVPVLAKPTSLINALTDKLVYHDDARFNLLGAILRIKWLCIILSFLEPARFIQRMKNKNAAQREFFVIKQLRIASAYFEREVPFGLY
jgi:hypothetical protein